MFGAAHVGKTLCEAGVVWKHEGLGRTAYSGVEWKVKRRDACERESDMFQGGSCMHLVLVNMR
jgi:hypothetical protein